MKPEPESYESALVDAEIARKSGDETTESKRRLARIGIGHYADGRTSRPIEAVSVEWRLKKEREYQKDPLGVHKDLVYRGFWLMAAQLKIDFEAGRLQ